MLLSDLLDPDELDAAIADGLVRVQTHPADSKLRIYNYTERCQFDRVWTDVTLTCRGLIVDDGVVVARPFMKFFNYGEHDAGSLNLFAPVEVTDKVDGCFPRGTALNLWGGGTITIDRVVRDKLPVTLVGMNEVGQLIPTLVTDWHNNGRKDNWLDLEIDARVSRRSGAGGNANKLRVTTNHHLYLNGEYAPAQQAQPGDFIVAQEWDASQSVVNLVRASLLGDGCLVNAASRYGAAKYQEAHSEKQEEYVLAIRKALGDCSIKSKDTVSGYGSKMVWARSREYPAFGRLRDEWYTNGVKHIPDDLSWVDDFAVAKWLMDDGMRQKFKRQADRISFSTHSFTKSDIIRLGDKLSEMYGTSYHVVNDGGRGYVLVINSGRKQQIRRLWQSVAPHVHPSMRYKVPEEFKNVPYIEMPIGNEITYTREVRILSVEKVEPTKKNFPSGRTGFDITTETGNYMARGVIVHNSLGVLFMAPDGLPAIATRGSFASEQAIHATQLYRKKYAGRWTPTFGLTYLFEIIYPANRIVLDYKELDDLVLLGAVNIATGVQYGPDELGEWTGPKARVFQYDTLAWALAAPDRPNSEGLVVRYLDTNVRVKIKQDAYVTLHRLVTGLNERVIWEYLKDHDNVNELLLDLPEEFYEWSVSVQYRLCEESRIALAKIYKDYNSIVGLLESDYSRKEFAQAANSWASRDSFYDNAGYFFRIEDKQDIIADVWKTLKPSAKNSMFADRTDAE